MSLKLHRERRSHHPADHRRSELWIGSCWPLFPYRNVISKAVAKPFSGSTNRISAPYSSRMLRVIGRPMPMPWPSSGSSSVVVDSKGRNHLSASASLTRFPVFSTRSRIVPSWLKICRGPYTASFSGGLDRVRQEVRKHQCDLGRKHGRRLEIRRDLVVDRIDLRSAAGPTILAPASNRSASFCRERPSPSIGRCDISQVRCLPLHDPSHIPDGSGERGYFPSGFRI